MSRYTVRKLSMDTGTTFTIRVRTDTPSSLGPLPGTLEPKGPAQDPSCSWIPLF